MRYWGIVNNCPGKRIEVMLVGLVTTRKESEVEVAGFSWMRPA